MPVKAVSNRDSYFAAWMAWLENNYQSIERISILGGEPFLQKELWTILEFMSTRQNKNLTISINTNLNASTDKVTKFVETCKKLLATRCIRRVHINASLDCWGPQAEFIRYGLSLSQWQQNFEYLLLHNWLAISVHQVITALSIGTALELQQRIAQYKTQYPRITQSYHTVDSGSEEIYHSDMFGSEFFKPKLDQLLAQFPIATEWDRESQARLEGICRLMDAAKPDRLRLAKDRKSSRSGSELVSEGLIS
jgi:hypothetical protein